MKNKYRNLWWKSLNTPRPEFYENDALCVLTYRGVQVFKLFHHGYDFVLGGACIACRAGITEAHKSIDELLDGSQPTCEQVANHLRSLGFKGYTYSEYTADWQAGKAA